MKIINETAYRSDQLRALIMRVAQDEVEPHRRNKTEVHIVYAKNDRSRYGSAFCNSGWVKLYLRKDGVVDSRRLALTIAHEFAHNRGLMHRDMQGSKRYKEEPGWRDFYAWADQYPIELKPAEPAPAKEKPDLQLVRYQRVLKQEARWTIKLKRAQKALKAAHKKKRYYERALAAREQEKNHVQI